MKGVSWMKRALPEIALCFSTFLSTCSKPAGTLTVKTNVQKISADDYHPSGQR